MDPRDSQPMEAKACSACGIEKGVTGFSILQWDMGSQERRCRVCRAQMAAPTERLCSGCGIEKGESCFSINQWTHTRRCKVCIDAPSPASEKLCSTCREPKGCTGYSKANWKKGDQRRCMTCTAHRPAGSTQPEKEKSCSTCGATKDNTAFSKHQWSHGAMRRCQACISGIPPEVGPSRTTTAQAPALEVGSSSAASALATLPGSVGTNSAAGAVAPGGRKRGRSERADWRAAASVRSERVPAVRAGVTSARAAAPVAVFVALAGLLAAASAARVEEDTEGEEVAARSVAGDGRRQAVHMGPQTGREL